MPFKCCVPMCNSNYKTSGELVSVYKLPNDEEARTLYFLYHTCYVFVDVAKYLLNAGNSYVIFGWFTTDPLEKYFGKLQQGSGGAYFITA